MQLIKSLVCTLLISVGTACQQSRIIMDPTIEDPDATISKLLAEKQLSHEDVVDYYGLTNDWHKNQWFLPNDWKPGIISEIEPLMIMILAGPEDVRGIWMFESGSFEYTECGTLVNFYSNKKVDYQ